MMKQMPFQAIPPELLAQIAQAAFRPPPGMGMQAPGMGMQAPQPQGDGGMGGLGMGMQGIGAAAGPLADWLRSYKGDPLASASYGSPRPALPAAVPGFGHGFGARGGV